MYIEIDEIQILKKDKEENVAINNLKKVFNEGDRRVSDPEILGLKTRNPDRDVI